MSVPGMARNLPLSVEPTFSGKINKQVDASNPNRNFGKPRANYGGGRPTTMQDTLIHNETVLDVASVRNTTRYRSTPDANPREVGAPRPSKLFVREDPVSAFQVNEEKPSVPAGQGIIPGQGRVHVGTIQRVVQEASSPRGNRRFAFRPAPSRFKYIPEPETFAQFNTVVPAPGPGRANFDNDPLWTRRPSSALPAAKPTVTSTNMTLVTYEAGSPRSNRDSDPLHRKRTVAPAAPYRTEAPYRTDPTA